MTLTREISSTERATYYRNALRLLRFAEERSPTQRRFGANADALWRDFAGGLKTADRIDVLLRDADTEWPGGFGARAVFGLRAVAEDDAFGAQWSSLEPIDGERVWKDVTQVEAVASSLDAILDQLAAAWELRPAPHELPRLTAGARLVIGGAGAIAAALRAFAGNADLNWPQQIVVVADHPAERQLAAAAAVLLNTTRPTVLRTSVDRGAPLVGHIPQVSSDATPEVRAAIAELTP